MADRDAFIVICWMLIFFLVLFECFYRRLKTRYSREIQPPPHRFTSLSTTGDGSRAEIGCPMEASDLPHYNCATRRAPLFTGLGFPTFPFYLRSDSVRIPIDVVDGEEEPPPTYEEALSYAKLTEKFHLAPYGYEATESVVVTLTKKSDNNLEAADSELEEYSTDEDAETDECGEETDFNNNDKPNEDTFKVSLGSKSSQCNEDISAKIRLLSQTNLGIV